MRNEIDFSCLNNLQEKLNEMGKKGAKLENKALEASADIILKEMVNKCPVRTGQARRLKKKSKVKKSKGEKSIKIGIQKEDNSDAYYLKFYEYGTSPHSFTAGGMTKGSKIHHTGQVARPFMRPALEKKRKEALEVAVNIMKEVLR